LSHTKTQNMELVNLVSAVINAQHGWAVRDQFEGTFQGGQSFEDQNSNALRYIRDTVRDILDANLLNEDAFDELQSYADDLSDYLTGG